MRHKIQTGQGLIEFALTVPIFLMLVFGIIDLARMLFGFSQVVDASRQAVRYGIVRGLEAGTYQFLGCVDILRHNAPHDNEQMTRQSMDQDARLLASEPACLCGQRSRMPRVGRRRVMDAAQRCPMARVTRTLREMEQCLQTLCPVG
jgi:hypothetical protein